MKIIAINSVDYGSTGKIMMQIASKARVQGCSYFTFSKKWRGQKERSYHSHFGFFIENAIHFILGKIIGDSFLFSFIGTFRLIKRIKKVAPDLIHLHNLHGSYINLLILFHYIKRFNIPVIWTLHDCWSFTGRCPYFDLTKCDLWKSGCHDCPYPKKNYPKLYIDTTRMIWKLKRRCFMGVENMTIVTPSEWLAGLVRLSFLRDYPIKVINNGIDLSVFKPTESDFRNRYGLEDKMVVLGVALDWGERKGLEVFIELSKRLPVNYRIVLIGTNNCIDATLPANIISIHRTQNQTELAEIYSAADVFANPTREENYPTVNMESLACGTPVITFKTGGSPEILDKTCGSVVDCDDIDAMEIEIRRICEEKPYSVEACLMRAKSFDMNDRFEEYVKLYKTLLKNENSIS